MKLPRRVPWTSLAELDQVCIWIYADETDADAKTRAINRLSAWRAITPLPQALEATLSLLSSIVLDESYALELQYSRDASSGQSSAPKPRNILTLNVRQSYATAIIRLVNGLVDPLQLGAYARSIASIAAQIGLPLWLVELRHAATHEDLPSLEVLRSAARESLTWLLHNYFLPTLSPFSIEASTPAVRLSPLQPLLKQYKSFMKTISRDASLKTQYKDELARIVRDIERWIGEAKVASSSMIFNGWGVNDSSDVDESERWALKRLSDALIDRGGLVPVSARKRLASDLRLPPVLSTSLISIWTPLLSALKVNHPSLPLVLVSTIVDFLLHNPKTSSIANSSSKDLSYDLCLSAWASRCVDEWETTPGGTEENSGPLRRKDIVVSLVSMLAIRADETPRSRKGASALVILLARSNPSLEEITNSLLSAVQRDSSISSEGPWTDEKLQTMEERLSVLLSSTTPTPIPEDAMASLDNMDSDHGLTGEHTPVPANPLYEIPRGWTQVPADIWEPCPIGVF